MIKGHILNASCGKTSINLICFKEYLTIITKFWNSYTNECNTIQKLEMIRNVLYVCFFQNFQITHAQKFHYPMATLPSLVFTNSSQNQHQLYYFIILLNDQLIPHHSNVSNNMILLQSNDSWSIKCFLQPKAY